MEKNYVYVTTELRKNECDNEFVVQSIGRHSTGIDDSKDLIVLRELTLNDCGCTDYEIGLWKGVKFGDRIGFDTSKQIGESYFETHRGLPYGDVTYVYELYENPEN